MSGGSRPAWARDENPEHEKGGSSRPMLDSYKVLLERCLASRMELQDKLRHGKRRDRSTATHARYRASHTRP